MKQITTKITIKVLVILISLTILSCKNDEHDYHNINDKIQAGSIHYKGVSVTSEVFNDTIKTIKISEGGKEFFITDRKSRLTSYNCSECHNIALKDIKSETVGKKAHWDIKLIHANEETMNCNTCHAENDMNSLHSLTNKSFDINLSYKLCSQCHQKEFKDWTGGAHGKQVGGWAPPRLSKTCVDCHNPHKPSFEKRWPTQFNTQKVKERK